MNEIIKEFYTSDIEFSDTRYKLLKVSIVRNVFTKKLYIIALHDEMSVYPFQYDNPIQFLGDVIISTSYIKSYFQVLNNLWDTLNIESSNNNSKQIIELLEFF